jgi:hypothetical protein
MVKTDSVVMLLLILEAAVVFPANVMKQEDLPNEVTWQKKHRPKLRIHFLGIKVVKLPQNR